GVLPMFILPTRSVGKLRGRIAKETQERLAELTSYVQETLSISGFLLARLFGAQDHERKRFADRAASVRDLQIRQSMAGRWFLMWLLLFGSIGPGQMVALVGPSGAGKTTLTYLASRLYDPVAGRVTFDGVDLKQLALGDLSRWMAMVTQETTLFNATLEENLRYARQDASRAEL